MKKYIFFLLPLQGHVNPTLAVARELVAHGEQVIYYLTEDFRQAVEETGAIFRHCDIDVESARAESRPDLEEVTDQPGVPVFFLQFMSGLIDVTRTVLQQIAEEVRAEQPDIIVYEYYTFWGQALAHQLQIPGLRFWSTSAVNENFNLFDIMPPESITPQKKMVLETAHQKLMSLNETFPLPALNLRDLIVTTEPLNIVFLPQEFQFGQECFDDRFRFVGPSILEPSHSNTFPLERLKERPTLYISLGTIFNDRPEFFNMCLQAFGNSLWQVVLSIGHQTDKALLAPLPENVLVAEYVPQLEVLQHTWVFVTHGGMNSTMEALYYGVPLVVIPQMMEQEMTAGQVVGMGLGQQLRPEEITVESLKKAVEEVSEKPMYREAVLHMQETIQQAGGYKAAAAAIIAFSKKRDLSQMSIFS